MTTTDDLLAEMLRNMPPRYAASSAVVSAYAAQLARVVDVSRVDLLPTTRIGSASGPWLTLLASDAGVRRSSGEADEDLQARVRQFEDALTPAAITAAVDKLLAPFSVVSTLIEHWANRKALSQSDTSRAAICNVSIFYGRVPGFTLFCPLIGGDPTLPVYSAIVDEVNRLKATGVPWTLILEAAP